MKTTLTTPTTIRSGMNITREARTPQKTRVLNNADQTLLESAILSYQDALRGGTQRDVDAAYETVCRMYPPLNFIHVWFRKYASLYDSREDFVQEYLLKFCDVLQNWKPRAERGKSRYNGKGTFANYFIGSLNNYYSNLLKQSAAAKRNLGVRCPICEVWCNPLSSHVFDQHHELLFQQVEMMGVNLREQIDCPFCKSHKAPRKTACICPEGPKPPRRRASNCDKCHRLAVETSLRKHLQDKHSSFLFERFRTLYPHHVTLSVRPLSVNAGTDDEGNERDLYDSVVHESPVEKLLCSALTGIQRQIVESVMIKKATSLSYDPEVYKVSAEEFQRELNSLKTTMTICGWDTEDHE